MQRSSLRPLLPLLSAAATSGCVISIGTDDEAETSETTSESSSTTDDEAGSSTSESGSTESGSTTDTSETTSDTTSTSESSTGTDTGSSTDSSSTDSGSSTDSTTGGGIEEPPPGYCGMAAGPEDPWATIDQYGQVIMPGDPLELECGGQGSWMFRIKFTVGGFQPNGKVVAIDASMDVEGYNIGPMGHFAAIWSEATWFLGCCDDPADYELYSEFCYYDQYITFYPPDAIADLAVLDGLPATVNLTVETPEGLIEEHLDVTLWAVYEQSWELCLYEYYAPLPEPILDVPLPIPLP